MAAPDLLLGDLAALGPQPRDVRRHDRLVELGKVVGAALADLDVADQELAEVEADRRAAPEAEVDHHQVVVLLAGQQVVGAGVPVAQQGWQGVRLGGQRGRVGAAARIRVRSSSSKAAQSGCCQTSSPIRIGTTCTASRPVV